MSGVRLTGDLAARLRGLAAAPADGRPLLESVADRQAENLRDHFDAKSRGGGGAAGNVREVTRTRATVGVDVPHARCFAAARPIVPGRFPRSWREANRQAARRFLKDAAADAGF